MIDIDWKLMDSYVADPIGYRFVDKVDVDGNVAHGTKLMSLNDSYQFSENMVIPSSYIMEALMQTGVFIVTTRDEIREKLMMFHSCESMRMYKEVRPGDVLKTHVTLNSWRGGVAKYIGEAFVEDKKVCSMKFTLVMPGELKRISPQI